MYLLFLRHKYECDIIVCVLHLDNLILLNQLMMGSNHFLLRHIAATYRFVTRG